MGDGSRAVEDRLEDERERLDLLHRLLEGKEDATEKRRRLLLWCERNSESEGRIWRELASFSKAAKTNSSNGLLLTDASEGNPSWAAGLDAGTAAASSPPELDMACRP